MSAGVRSCPSASVSGRHTRNNVMHITLPRGVSPVARCRAPKRGKPELSYLGRKLDSMGTSKRRSGPGIKHGQPGWQHQAPAEPTNPAQRFTRLSVAQVLERIERARLARDEAEAELAVLIDHAVGLGIGWPDIAARLGVTRQAARQHYQRRHRDGPNRRVA